MAPRVESEETPMPGSNRLERLNLNVTTAGSILVAIVTATVTLTIAFSAKPSEDKVESIAQTVGKVAAEQAVKAAELADQPRRERNRLEIESLKAMVYEQRIYQARSEETLKGILLMTAESRGPWTLRKVKANLAANEDPIKGVVPGGN